MSGWRNRALSSKLSLQSSASTSPPAVTIRGLISASEASVSMNSLTKFLKNVAPFLAVSPVRAERLADLPGLEIGQAEADVDRHAEDLFGRLVGDGLDLDAPLGRGHQRRGIAGRGRSPSPGRARGRCRARPSRAPSRSDFPAAPVW